MGWGIVLGHGVKLPEIKEPRCRYCFECDVSEVGGPRVKCFLCGGPMWPQPPRYWPLMAGDQQIVRPSTDDLVIAPSVAR